MSNIGRLFVAVAVLLLLGGGLVACQREKADPEPSQVPQSAQVLPTPSDKLPELPAEATRETRKSAVAFGRHYYELINYGRATGDWGPVKEVTATGCESCKDFWAKEPQRMDNELSIRLVDAPEVSRFSPGEATVVFFVSSDSDVTDLGREPLREWSDHLALVYAGNSWSVADLEINPLCHPRTVCSATARDAGRRP